MNMPAAEHQDAAQVRPVGDEYEHSIERDAPVAAPVLSPKTLTSAGDLLRALAAPVRIAIVMQLRESERCVHELVEALNVAQPLISQHLRVLKSAGVVYGERHGREVVYRLVDEHLSHIVVDAVEHVQETSGPHKHLQSLHGTEEP
ncbi:ArsR family transcriptional regulator [Pseudonocardiaceae bacterium YIM PH 21723]|nr:ArsR family transcriptional regulator [Pseudonocardiaceae bacterium YIM PH 21723]